MRLPAAVALVILVAGCESMGEKIDASRQDRCARAEWATVGERDGFAGNAMQAERYAEICGDMFQPAPYKEGLQKGLARRPKPAV